MEVRALLSLLIFLSLVIFLVLNSIVFDINIATPILLWLLFGMHIFIHPFTFNLLVFLV